MPADDALVILALGDVVGKPGRRALSTTLPGLVEQTGAGFVMVNGENASGGLGLRAVEADALLECGASVITSGNHIWKHRDIRAYLDESQRVIRPANYPPEAPGRGAVVGQAKDGTKVATLNLQGLLFMEDLDCPFRVADALLPGLRAETPIVLVDFHAEATSEKRALGFHLDGRVTAVMGTHTHVPTADAEVLAGGTGYLTDLGMCGPADSVIGVDKKPAVARFTTRLPTPFGVAKGRCHLQGAVLRVDRKSGRCLEIERHTWEAQA